MILRKTHSCLLCWWRICTKSFSEQIAINLLSIWLVLLHKNINTTARKPSWVGQSAAFLFTSSCVIFLYALMKFRYHAWLQEYVTCIKPIFNLKRPETLRHITLQHICCVKRTQFCSCLWTFWIKHTQAVWYWIDYVHHSAVKLRCVLWPRWFTLVWPHILHTEHTHLRHQIIHQ